MKNKMTDYAILLKFLTEKCHSEEKGLLYASFLMISICLIKQEAGPFIESQRSESYRGALRRWWSSV